MTSKGIADIPDDVAWIIFGLVVRPGKKCDVCTVRITEENYWWWSIPRVHDWCAQFILLILRRVCKKWSKIITRRSSRFLYSPFQYKIVYKYGKTNYNV